MGEKARPGAAFLAYDVGKAAHRACAVGAAGELLFNREVANRPADTGRALAEAGPAAGVVVALEGRQQDAEEPAHILVHVAGRDGNRFGRHCDACRARGMRHNKALKAVARKRLKVIYAVMRDRAPYREG